MFCPNCGKNIQESASFCPNCGTNLSQFKEVEKTNNTTTEMLSKKSKAFLEPKIAKIKEFCGKYKMHLGIVFSCLFLLIIGLVIYNKYHDFTKISWDTDYKDINIDYTSQRILKLKVNATGKKNEEIKDIEFSVTGGDIEAIGTSVDWNLPYEDGEYTIVAKAPSGKKVEKTVNVVTLNNDLAINFANDNTDDDFDKDGLLNDEEDRLGTDKRFADSDLDGLDDYYEVNTSKTDPLKEDTDGDGLSDGDEIALELNPLEKDSKGDGVEDSRRTLNYLINDSKLGVSVEINGKGNIASTTVDVFKNTAFSNVNGLLDEVYNFSSPGTIDKAIVKINYSLDEVNAKDLDEDNLTLYYLNEKTKELEIVPTTIDKDNKILVATLNHFSRYIIGDINASLDTIETNIMFVIDNSVSMYSEAQMIQLGYKNSTGAVGNDKYFKRLTLTNDMINIFGENYNFGVSEFSGNYVKLQDFTTNGDSAKKTVESMRNNWHSETTGTNIVAALSNGIAEFNNIKDNNNYLILLTDGKNTIGSLSGEISSLIIKANNNNVKICVIGLGNEIDTDALTSIATSTGCNYYNAADSSALDEIYSIIAANINYNYVDTDGDKIVDGVIIADSGFIVNRDGFSFDNYITVQSDGGNCYGMALFAMLYYKNQLPTSMSSLTTKDFILLEGGRVTMKSNGYDLSNTYFVDGHKNLYDYKIKNEALNVYFEGNIRSEIEDGIWKINPDYEELFNTLGITKPYNIKKYKGTKYDISGYESILLDLENQTFINNVDRDDRELLNAIWRLFILQLDNVKEYRFSNQLVDGDETLGRLIDDLNNNTPTLLDLGGNGNHAVNAIKVIQDINDSNKFKIEIYDNNYHGITRYISATRKKNFLNKVVYKMQYENFDSVDLHYVTIR